MGTFHSADLTHAFISFIFSIIIHAHTEKERKKKEYDRIFLGLWRLKKIIKKKHEV